MWYADGKELEDIKKDILEFLKTYAPDLSLPRWEPAIDRQIKLLEKYHLIEVDSIGITQSELGTIQKLDKPMLRKLAFTLLCIAKFKNSVNPKNNDWVSCSDKEIFRLANIQKNIVEQSKLFRELRDANLLRFSKIVDNLNVQMLFIDKEGVPVRFIVDFRNLGNQALAMYDNSYFKCEKCGLWVCQNKNGTKKYCHNCEKYIPIEKKYITCIDCGIEFLINSKDTESVRCGECYKKYRTAYYRENKRKNRAMSTAQI